MKTYSINYDCSNCGCKTCKSFEKGKLAPATVKCENCGCVASKIIIDNKPIVDEIPLPPPKERKNPPYFPPRDEQWPKVPPWYDEFYPNPFGKPFKMIIDKDFPRLPYNDNIVNDGHWTVCTTPPKRGM